MWHESWLLGRLRYLNKLEIAFDNLFMGCVFNINTVHKTVEKLTFQAFYWSSQLSLNLLKK